jgi:hypothetical protein|tara:strand:+ start:748 stop:1026 length:279 start_codon:yes stop_codon:yes gene_type:complete
MKVLQSLRKRTKTGVSVWCFCYDAEMKLHYAVGGEDVKVIKAVDRQHLRTIFNSFLSYGYSPKLPQKKQMLVADPWKSQLPLEDQLALAELA